MMSRDVCQADYGTLVALGFSAVAAKKAIFVTGAVLHEAMAWLTSNQHSPALDVPWNMTQLQV